MIHVYTSVHISVNYCDNLAGYLASQDLYVRGFFDRETNKVPVGGLTGFDTSWISLFHLAICSGTKLCSRRLVPMFCGIFVLAGAQTQETKKLVIFRLQKIAIVILLGKIIFQKRSRST